MSLKRKRESSKSNNEDIVSKELYDMFNNFVEEQQEFKNNFPNIKFFIAFSLNDLNTIVSDKNIIKVKLVNCNCNIPETNNYITVLKNENFIYIKDILKKLNEMNYNPKCNHIYLKSIKKISEEIFCLNLW